MNRREFLAASWIAAPLLGAWPRQTSARRWSHWSTPAADFDVRAYGAVGDGRSDDSGAFERVFLAAAQVGGRVIVPPGTYITERLLKVPAGVSVAGAKALAVLERRGTDSPITLACVGTRDTSITGLTFRGAVSHAVVVEHAANILVSECRLTGATVRRSAYSSGILIVASTDVIVRGCVFELNGGEGELQGADIQIDGLGQRSSRIQVIENDCHSTDVAVNIRCYDTAESTITGNRVSGARMKRLNNHGYGILVYQTVGNPGSCFGNTISHNRVAHTQGSGIYLQQSSRSTVSNNHLEDVGTTQDDSSLPVAGIALNQSSWTTLTDNEITGSGHAGISVASNKEGVGYVTIEGNAIGTTAGAGIHLRGLLVNVTVRHNELHHTHGGIGSYSLDAQCDVAIVENTIVDCVGPRAAITLRNAAESRVVGNNLIRCSPGIQINFADAASRIDGNVVDGVVTGETGPGVVVRRAVVPSPR